MSTTDNNAAAAQLAAYFQPHRLTQTEVASRLGVTPQAVSSWVSGRTRPQPHHRRALALLTGVPEDAWLSEEERRAIEAATEGER